jgi:hypothetical protein
MGVDSTNHLLWNKQYKAEIKQKFYCYKIIPHVSQFLLSMPIKQVTCQTKEIDRQLINL